MFRVYAHTRILYKDDDTTRSLPLCSNAQDPRLIADCAHGFHGVHDEIQYHLLQQDPINNYRRKLSRHFRPQGRPVSTKFTVRKGNDFASGFGRNQAPKTDRLNQVPFGSSGIAENPLRPGSWQESCGTLRTFVGLTPIWNQSPLQRIERPCLSLGIESDRQNLLARGDIVTDG
jgi:hypothetical protein